VFYARTRLGRIAAVDSRTGKITRFLTEGQPGGGPDSLAVDADRKALIFQRGDGTCAGHLAKITLPDGPEVALPSKPDIGPEGDPAIRPKTSEIAFSRYHCDGRATDLVIGAPDLGEEKVLAEVTDHPGLRWSPDGTLLSAGSWSTTKVFSVSNEGTLSDSRTIPNPEGCFTNVIAFTRAHTLIANRTCGRHAGTHIVIVELELRNFRTVRTPMDLGVGNYGGGIALDISGRHLLLSVGRRDGPGPGCEGVDCVKVVYTYYRLSGGKLTKIAADPPYRPQAW
jgi:hypothetical protein